MDDRRHNCFQAKLKLNCLTKKLRKPSLTTINKFKEYNLVDTRLAKVARNKHYDNKFKQYV